MVARFLLFVAHVQARTLDPKWLPPSSFPVAIHAETVYNSDALLKQPGMQRLLAKEEESIFNAIRANDATERTPLTYGSYAGYAFSKYLIFFYCRFALRIEHERGNITFYRTYAF